MGSSRQSWLVLVLATALLGYGPGCTSSQPQADATGASPKWSPPPPTVLSPAQRASEALRQIGNELIKLEREVDILVAELESLRDTRSMAVVSREIIATLTDELIGISVGVTIDEAGQVILSRFSPTAAAAAQKSGVVTAAASVLMSFAVIHDRLEIAALKLDQARMLAEDISFLRKRVIPVRLELAVRARQLADNSDRLRARHTDLSADTDNIVRLWDELRERYRQAAIQAEEEQQ